MKDLKKLSNKELYGEILVLQFKRDRLKKELSIPRGSKRPQSTASLEDQLKSVYEELKPMHEEWNRREDDRGIIFSKTTWNKIKTPIGVSLFFLFVIYNGIFNAGLTLQELGSNGIVTFGVFGLMAIIIGFFVKKLDIFFGLLLGWGVVYLLWFIYEYYFL